MHLKYFVGKQKSPGDALSLQESTLGKQKSPGDTP